MWDREGRPDARGPDESHGPVLSVGPAPAPRPAVPDGHVLGPHDPASDVFGGVDPSHDVQAPGRITQFWESFLTSAQSRDRCLLLSWL